MSDAAARTHQATVADYELFIETRPDEERWELIDGGIEMMTPDTLQHGDIVGNLFAPLSLSLRGSGFRSYVFGLLVQRSESRAERTALKPDVLVRCGPIRDRNFADDPVVVVEVMSRFSIHKDRGPKFAFYKRLPSLRHMVLVYQDQMRVEHYRRAAEGWSFVVLRRLTDRLVLDAVDFTIDLDAIYGDVPVLRPADPPEGYEDDVPILIP